MGANERAAHTYADSGWPVFRTGPDSKIPIKGTSGFLDATDDHRQIQSWWRSTPRANVAIATGHPGPDVLDIDNHGEDANGFDAFNLMKREGLVGEPGAIIETPHRGLHAYYQGTGQPNGAIAQAHVDFRGKGGYVVAPPSVVDGRPYVVVSHQPSAGTFDWRAAKKLLDPEPERPAPKREGPARDTGRQTEAWAQVVENAQEGNRNRATFWAACRVVEAGRPEDLERIAGAARRVGLSDREISATIASARRTAAPGIAEREAG